MQSRLATKLIPITTKAHLHLWIRPATTAIPGRKTRYETTAPEVHAGDPDVKDLEAPKLPKEEGKPPPKIVPEPLKPATPFGPKIESSPVKPSSDPIIQWKRRYSNATNDGSKDVNCVGLDGWPENGAVDDRKRQEEEDDMEYYKHNKASPLSEIKLVDTRKPIEKEWDSRAGKDVVGWREEQLESAEETLLKAWLFWKEQAMKGIPDYPHSRVLRELLHARGDYSLD